MTWNEFNHNGENPERDKNILLFNEHTGELFIGVFCYWSADRYCNAIIHTLVCHVTDPYGGVHRIYPTHWAEISFNLPEKRKVDEQN